APDRHATPGAGNAGPSAPGAAPRAAPRAVPRASGTLPAHYAPRTPLELVAAPAFEFRLRTLLELGKPFAVLALRARPASLAARPDVAWIEAGRDAADYAHKLYARLRELDALRTERLLVERPPQAAEWEAILDRLARAAHAQGLHRAAE
ncbi:MAG: translation factor Sua5, partial [Burkholderiales bacterium]